MHRMTAKFERALDDLVESMQHIGKLRQVMERLSDTLR